MSTDKYPNTTEVRMWAEGKPGCDGISSAKGALPKFVVLGWNKAHPDRPYVMSQAHHGTTGGYNKKGCRCERCTDAINRYARGRYAAIRDDFEGDAA